MTTFSALQKLTAAALEMTTVTNREADATSGTTTSLTYTSSLTTSGTFTLNFVAPLSGKVLITVGARMFQSVAARHVYMAYALSGASTYTESDDDAAIIFADTSQNSEATIFKTTLRTGLVAGGSYTITARYRTQTSGTASYAGRLLTAQPVV
jgi:hypothetical protein